MILEQKEFVITHLHLPHKIIRLAQLPFTVMVFNHQRKDITLAHRALRNAARLVVKQTLAYAEHLVSVVACLFHSLGLVVYAVEGREKGEPNRMTRHTHTRTRTCTKRCVISTRCVTSASVALTSTVSPLSTCADKLSWAFCSACSAFS